jgi:hypothetical protein
MTIILSDLKFIFVVSSFINRLETLSSYPLCQFFITGHIYDIFSFSHFSHSVKLSHFKADTPPPHSHTYVSLITDIDKKMLIDKKRLVTPVSRL